MSVDLSITITAAVPRPDRASRRPSKSIGASHDLRGRHQRHRGAAGDHRQQIVPAAAHAAAMLLDQLAERDAHLLLDVAGLVHVAGDAEQLGAHCFGRPKPANHAAPRRRIVGATAIVSTLLTVVGQP
jgi:hypothetical protein